MVHIRHTVLQSTDRQNITETHLHELHTKTKVQHLVQPGKIPAAENIHHSGK